VGYPNQLKSARITAGTPISQGPGKVGEAEQATADALGIPIDTNFGAKVVVSANEKGVANGVATLGADGKVPAGQLPAGAAFGGVTAYRDGSDQVLVQYGNYILFNGEEFDTDGFHDNVTNPDRITIPAGKAGYYLLVADITLSDAAGITVEARLEASVGSASPFVGPTLQPSNHSLHLAWVRYLAVGDYVRLMCWCATAGPKAVMGANNTRLSAVLLGT